MMARKRSPIPRLADDCSRHAQIAAATALCGELSLGSAIVAGEWVGTHERLGRNRLALRGLNSEKEASWTG
jgi:hydroxymethylglutaryl-CoA reductase